MAVAIVQKQAESLDAITTHYIDDGWDRSPLPMGVRNRLASVERCVAGMVTINHILRADALGKADVADNGGNDEDDFKVQFPGAIAAVDMEGLRMALMELGSAAAGHLDAIRNNEHKLVAVDSSR